jgi:hypothetical protein
MLWLFVFAAVQRVFLAMSLEVWIGIMLAGITVLVTLLGIMLAVFALGIGLAAIWGYSGLKDAAREQAAIAAREVSLTEITQKATEAAKEVAKFVALEVTKSTISENKDKWLRDLDLSVRLAQAQSNIEHEASDTVGAVSAAYPGEEVSNANPNASTPNDAGPNNPTAPGSTSG